jgi:hypothetical protein
MRPRAPAFRLPGRQPDIVELGRHRGFNPRCVSHNLRLLEQRHVEIRPRLQLIDLLCGGAGPPSAPQWAQNLRPARFSRPHFEQRIDNAPL